MSMVHCRGCGKEIHESAPTCPHCGAPQQAVAGSQVSKIKSQTAATLFAMFLGGFGGHKFYLGKVGWGIAYILFCWTGLPGIIAFFEMLQMVFMSQQKWAEKYNGGVISPPVHIVLKVIALILPIMAFVGIIAAIAIPAFSDYKAKAEQKELLSSLKNGLVVLIASSEEKDITPVFASVRETVKKGSSHVVEVDPYIAGEYMDVGAKLDYQDGSQIFFTSESKCYAVNVPSKALPKMCDAVPSYVRPVVKKIGWSKDYSQSEFNSCTTGMANHPEINSEKFCSCVIGKAMTALSERLDQEDKEKLEQYKTECQSAGVEAEEPKN